MSPLRKYTIIILAIVTIGLISWDVFAYINGGSMVTISLVILGWSREFPPLPFAFGVLCGHLFFPIGIEKK